MAEGKSLSLPKLTNTHKSFDVWKPIIRAFLRSYKEGDAFIYCTTHVEDVSKLSREQRSSYFHALSTILATVDQDSLNYVIRPPLQNSSQDDDPFRLWEALEKHFYPLAKESRHSGKLLFYALRMNPLEKPEAFIARVMDRARAINQLVDKENPDWRTKLEKSLTVSSNALESSSSPSSSSSSSSSQGGRLWKADPIFPIFPPGYIQQDDMLSVIISSIRHFYPIEYPNIRSLDLPFDRLLDHIRDVCVTQGTSEPISEETLQAFYHNDPQVNMDMATVRAIRLDERRQFSKPPRKRIRLSSHQQQSHSTHLPMLKAETQPSMLNTATSQGDMLVQSSPVKAVNQNGLEQYCLIHGWNASHDSTSCRRITGHCKTVDDIHREAKKAMMRNQQRIAALTFSDSDSMLSGESEMEE